MNQAWVVAVDMGYGHQRAAYPFRDIAYEGMITANTGAMVDSAERQRWTAMQGLYEGLSRVNKVPVIGPWLWRTYDRLQAISPHYPFSDLSKPSLASMRLDRLMQYGVPAERIHFTGFPLPWRTWPPPPRICAGVSPYSMREAPSATATGA